MMEKVKAFLASLKPFLGRCVGVLLGLVTAVLFMTLGFWRTLLLLLLGALGYILGFYFDNKEAWLQGYAKLRIFVIHLISKGE